MVFMRYHHTSVGRQLYLILCTVARIVNAMSNACFHGLYEDSYWLLPWRVFTIGSMSADQHKQIGILPGAISFNMKNHLILLTPHNTLKIE
jgi:hypothetical protein